MRFGIAVSLWSKEEWGGESDVTPAPKKKAPAKKAPAKKVEDTQQVDPAMLGRFQAACDVAHIPVEQVTFHAGVDLDKATLEDFHKLRDALEELKAMKAEEQK